MTRLGTLAARIQNRPDYKWIVIGLLFFAGFLNLEDRVVIFSVLPLIKRDLAMTDFQVGALITVFLWVYAFCSPVAGYFGDRLPRRRVVVGCVFLWSTVTVIAGFVQSADQLTATRILLGITQAFYLPASLAVLADCHDRKTRGKAVAVLTIGMNLGPIVGGAVAGWIGENYGWRPTLWVLGLLGVLLTFVLFVFLQAVPVGGSETQKAEPARPSSLGAVLRVLVHTPSYLLIAFGVALFQVSGWMLVTWLPLLLYEEFGLRLMQSGFLANLAITGPVLVGYVAGGTLSDVFGTSKPSNRMLLMIGAYSLTIPWPLVFRAADGATAVLISAALFQLFRSLGESNSIPLIYEVTRPEHRSTAIGISNSANCLFAGAGALVVGYFKQQLGLQFMFGMIPLFVLASLAALIVASRWYVASDIRRIQSETLAASPGIEPAAVTANLAE